MSKYTVELRWLLETQYNLRLNEYPIFEESYRAGLNTKITNHFKYREIGFETPGLFVDRLSERMSMIMPYYNQLYRSALISFDPLLTQNRCENVSRETTEAATSQMSQNLTQDQTQNVTGTATQNVGMTTNTDNTESTKDTTAASKTSNETGTNQATSEDTKNRKNVKSDTPQGLLTIGSIEDAVYASSAEIGVETDNHTENSTHTINGTEVDTGSLDREITGNITGTSSTETTETTGNDTTAKTTLDKTDLGRADKNFEETFVRNLKGYDGVTASKMLLEFRSTFLNIDQQVIGELEDLFMGLY